MDIIVEQNYNFEKMKAVQQIGVVSGIVIFVG
jgi:hypothetical protein